MQDHKVKITPYSESASESTQVKMTKEHLANIPRRLDEHSPIIIVPEDIPTTTEPEEVYLTSILYHNTKTNSHFVEVFFTNLSFLCGCGFS